MTMKRKPKVSRVWVVEYIPDGSGKGPGVPTNMHSKRSEAIEQLYRWFDKGYGRVRAYVPEEK